MVCRSSKRYDPNLFGFLIHLTGLLVATRQATARVEKGHEHSLLEQCTMRHFLVDFHDLNWFLLLRRGVCTSRAFLLLWHPASFQAAVLSFLGVGRLAQQSHHNL